jgi:hypothetical protein
LLIFCSARCARSIIGLWAWHPDRKQLYFKASKSLAPLKRKWSQGSGRTVFRAYSYRSDGALSFYRHDSCRVRFLRYGRRWYLQLEPSYHFTIEGHRESLYAYDQLRKIKALEGSGAVRDALRMWAAIFAQGASR